MPKEIKEMNNQEGTQLETNENTEIGSTSDYIISINYVDNINKNEKKLSFEKPNNFIFFTPTLNEKRNYYIPKTPKKNKMSKEENIKGKNLLLIFKDM